VPAHDALTATLLYRLVAYWLPLPVGGVAYVLFRLRYDALRSSRTGSAVSPIRDDGDGDTHRAHIMRKLQLETRAELVMYALANGVIGPSAE
jgi:hypothetical protein